MSLERVVGTCRRPHRVRRLAGGSRLITPVLIIKALIARALIASVLITTVLIALAPMGDASEARVSAPAATGDAAGTPQELSLSVPGGPMSGRDARPVVLDSTLWVPAVVPAPAVVLAHGFGGSKDSVRDVAMSLVDRGFVVLSYSARGFGRSTGQISMNASDFEVADARALVDMLAQRPEVARDGPNDPRVGFAGSSYGGALSLLVAGDDARVDAVAADITWSDLESALFPQMAVPASGSPILGPFKKEWAAWFFSVGIAPPSRAAAAGGPPSATTDPGPANDDVTICGRFTPAWCAAYTQAAVDGQVSAQSAALMRDSSPARVTASIAVPTLLGGGLSDSLFPIDQVNANAEQIRAAHPDVPVSVVWHGGGHGAPADTTVDMTVATGEWFTTWLAPNDPSTTSAGARAGVPAFTATLADAQISLDNTQAASTTLVADRYPGLFGTQSRVVALAGPAQSVLSPAGGLPAAVTSLPGLGSLVGALPTGLLPELAGQTATFRSAPLTDGITVIGSPRLGLSVRSESPVPELTLFATMRIVQASGRSVTPGGVVAPIRLTRIDRRGQEMSIVLPTVVAPAEPGDVLEVVLGTTDRGYRMPLTPAVSVVELTTGELVLPTTPTQSMAQGTSVPIWLGLGLLVPLGIAALMWWRRPRGSAGVERSDLEHMPLAVVNLTKEFPSGVRAVDDVSFEVPPGAVLGLLGPNGAGKTTTMRMIMGLIRPSAGAVFVFGRRVWPGAPILARVGSLVEGAGFLPFLNGRVNLDLYWQAKGTPGPPANLTEVLAIADLGTALDRRVKSYSQGMRQRLGIAQAMIGAPDVLILDEPTNGLDPPQIKAMREVLHRYASTGRTVIVSSHLLSEVQQTCTHVVVMHRGRVVAVGTVDEILAGRDSGRLEDAFLDIVGNDLTIGQG